MLRSSFEQYSEQLARETKRKAMQDELYNKTVETAIALLNKNIPIQEIADVTGLNIDEINELKK